MNTLMRCERPISTLSSLFEDFFGDNVYESVNRELAIGEWPRVDIEEATDNYSIKADLPGMDKKDVAITIENGTLLIEGEKKTEQKREKGRYYHLERSYGKFSRSFTLPDGVDAEKITASMENGVLLLQLPKSEQAKPRSIEVKIN
jgi:HSP20 family protein